MTCPACQTVHLVMSDRSGIEIDYCPNCRGVWLDRGELDKIIERAAGQLAPAPRAAQPQAPAPPPQNYPPQAPPPAYGHPQPGHYKDDYYYKRKRKKSWLEDIFD
jgi:uncharacterized protein